MTTIAFKDSVMASDSRYSETSVGITRGPKIFRKNIAKPGKPAKDVLIGIAGDVFAAMLFVDWYGTNDADLHKTLTEMTDDGFFVMIWDGKKLLEANRYCRPCEIAEPYYAIGSGGVHAITAMDCGRTAIQAVQMAAKRDSATGGRIVHFKL